MQNPVFGQKELVWNPSQLSLSLTFEGLCSPELIPKQMYCTHDWNVIILRDKQLHGVLASSKSVVEHLTIKCVMWKDFGSQFIRNVWK